MAAKRKRDRDRMAGMIRVYDEMTGQELHNTIAIETGQGRASVELGLVLDPERRETVATRHPAAVVYQERVSTAMRRLAHERRPIASLWVPKPKRRAEADPRCAECGGSGETMIGEDEDARMVPCPACGGSG